MIAEQAIALGHTVTAGLGYFFSLQKHVCMYIIYCTYTSVYKCYIQNVNSAIYHKKKVKNKKHAGADLDVGERLCVG